MTRQHPTPWTPIATLLAATLTALTLTAPATAQTVGHGATATVPLTATNRATILPGGRADLWKALRWCVSLEDTIDEDPQVPGVTAISVTIQYQKQRNLFCDSTNCYFGQILNNEGEFSGWNMAAANTVQDDDTRLNRWYPTLTYTAIPLAAADGSGNRTFDRDGISGTVTTGDRLTALTVNKPGRVVFAKPSGSTALTANGGACR